MYLRSPANPNSRTRWVRTAAATAAGLLAMPAAQAESFDCVIDPAITIELASPVSGTLAEVLVTRGDVVESGQVVARLESTVEQATVALNRQRAASVARIEAQRARVDFNRKRMERADKLLSKQNIPKDRYDETAADLKVSERQLAEERTEHRLAELELARSQAVLAQRTVRSPIDGVVVERSLSPGEFVHQDAHIATLAKLDPLHVEVYLPVKRYPQVAVGDTATVAPAEPIGGTHQATVDVVDRVFDPASGTFGVRLKLTNPGNHLPGGQRCRVQFDFASAPVTARTPASE